MPSQISFTRTAEAAQSDRLTKWDLIAAIAEDAIEADLPITGIASILEAKKALDAAGNEYADRTVRQLCGLAKFDLESSPEQRQTWRRYGWSTVDLIVRAGWSQEATFNFLGREWRSTPEVRAAIQSNRQKSEDVLTSFDDRCAQWVSRLHLLLRDGRHLATEAESMDAFSGHASMALNFYAAMNDRVTDAELRQLLNEETTK